MSVDPLSRYTQALREETAAREHPGDDARDELLRDLGERPRSRPIVKLMALPLVAAALISAAWAGATGRFGAFFREDAPAPIASPAPIETPPPSGGANHNAAPAHVAAPDVDEALDGGRREKDVKPLPAPSAPTPRASAGRPAIEAAPSAAQEPNVIPAEEDPDALYRAAHQAHFGARNPAAALAAWDRYLAVARSGPFVVEARYNRALSLVRLGRRQEAAAALRPFAAGEYGPYRQKEAGSLLGSIAFDGG